MKMGQTFKQYLTLVGDLSWDLFINWVNEEFNKYE